MMMLKSTPIKILILIVALVGSVSCSSNHEKRFDLLNPDDTGITFINELNPSPELNIFNYLYFYDGAGVAAGDLNGNGLPDLYFTSNQGQNKLYLNKGDFVFEDVTEKAFGNLPDFWSTGVTLADVTNDGRLDIYVSNVGGYMQFEGYNQLFINTGNNDEGVPIFEEQASEYGLDFVGLSTQAVFFDYNQSGRLDMYLLNHSVHEFGTFNYSTIREEFHPLAGDRLFRNDGERFTDVTEEAGIYNSALGYGLGIAIGDLNQNGLPDIYIGNDFHEDDYLYINNGDGTFSESLAEMIQHTSYSSMGNDIMDVNNDGLLDILSLDMLPENYEMRQAAAEEDPLDIYNMKRSYGYKHKFSRNTLQLNRGNGRFSEIGMLAGIHATDWSWAALGADFNNTGYVDLFITNGIQGRTNDLDYINFISQDEIQYRLRGTLTENDLTLADQAPSVKVPNYLYKNDGSLIFTDVSEEWGIDHPGYSSGAVYVDLNNDGDLDLVINNVNQTASIYRNQTRERFPGSNYLKFKFDGPDGNRLGIGTKIQIPLDDNKYIVRELYLSRGFQSAVEPVLHVGLNTLEVIPEVKVTWPDGKSEILTNPDVNQTVTFDYSNASENIETQRVEEKEHFFTEITDSVNISFKHEENSFIEFNREVLIPHMVSREGPALAIGDVNGNGLEDIFLGGARHQKSFLYLQQQDGSFIEHDVFEFEADSEFEDVDAHFADFTGNGSLDLLVVSGGNEYSGTSEYMLSRIYINDGEGNFTRDKERMPEAYLTGSVTAITDVNGNGLYDIFIGARTIPWRYGEKPVSYLLLNKGEGYFEIDESEFGKQFKDLGLVTGAEWADMNGDGHPDLVVASEWSDIIIIYNNRDEGVVPLPNSTGIWNTLAITDLNNNGRQDIIAGNLGLNSKFKASEEEPLRMYVNDFDDNGTSDQIVTYTDNENKERLFARKDELAEQLPYIDQRFDSYTEFARADIHDVIDRNKVHDAQRFEVKDLSTSVFYNTAAGWERHALPIKTQFSPVQNFLIYDLNKNGFDDVISVGNFYDVNIQRGRYDADYGNVLLNDAEGRLNSVPNKRIPWYIEGQIRKIEKIKIGEAEAMILAENNGSIRVFRINNQINQKK